MFCQSRRRAQPLPLAEWVEVCFMESTVMTKSRPRSLPTRAPPARTRCVPERAAPATPAGDDDAFFRHIVAGHAQRRARHHARRRVWPLINDEAYRIFGIAAQPDDVGQPVAMVLRDHPDVVRVLAGAFDLHHLPNRVEMRLKPSNKVIGYTLALVR